MNLQLVFISSIIVIIIAVVAILVYYLWYLPSQQVTEEEVSKPIEEVSKPIEEEIKPIEKETVPYSFINKQITTHLDKDRCIEIDESRHPHANIYLWKCLGTDNQAFSFNKEGNQQIIVKHSGLCLRGKDDDMVIQDSCDLSGTKWSYDENKKIFKNEDTGKCLGLFAFNTETGSKMMLFDCNDKDNQKWEISPIKLT